MTNCRKGFSARSPLENPFHLVALPLIRVSLSTCEYKRFILRFLSKLLSTSLKTVLKDACAVGQSKSLKIIQLFRYI